MTGIILLLLSPLLLVIPYMLFVVLPAGTYSIVVQPSSGATINGNPDYRMVSDWGVSRFYYDGTNFGVG